MSTSKKSSQPLRHLAEAVAKSQELAKKQTELQARIAYLAKQIASNGEKPKGGRPKTG